MAGRDAFLGTARNMFNSVMRVIEFNRSTDSLSDCLLRLDHLSRNLNRMTTRFPECGALLDTVREAIDAIEDMKRSNEEANRPRPALQRGGLGRPRYMVSEDQLRTLLEFGFSNREIGRMV